MAGNSRRQGARRKSGTKQGSVVGSGGQRRRGLQAKGQTPPAEARKGHPAARRDRYRERQRIPAAPLPRDRPHRRGRSRGERNLRCAPKPRQPRRARTRSIRWSIDSAVQRGNSEARQVATVGPSRRPAVSCRATCSSSRRPASPTRCASNIGRSRRRRPSIGRSRSRGAERSDLCLRRGCRRLVRGIWWTSRSTRYANPAVPVPTACPTQAHLGGSPSTARSRVDRVCAARPRCRRLVAEHRAAGPTAPRRPETK